MRSRAVLRGIPLSNLGFLETPLTPFCDFVLDPEHRQPAIQAICSELEKSNEFQLLSLNRLLSDSVVWNQLRPALHPITRTYERTSGEVVYLPIAGGWDEFYNAKSRKFRMTRRSIANKIARLGQIRVECARTPEELSNALPALLSLSALGWKQREGRDLLDQHSERRLLSSIVEWAGGRGAARIWLLRKDSDVIAAEFHVIDGTTAYGLRAQYDPQYFSYSPGRALDYEIVERLFQEGFTAYDMGPGVADYKRNWSDATYPIHQLESFSSGLYPQFVAKLHYHWAPALKQTRMGQWLASRSGRECQAVKEES
jgi:CelD/BcsL family acetyltransferase involved in cellulose biosynthesis